MKNKVAEYFLALITAVLASIVVGLLGLEITNETIFFLVVLFGTYLYYSDSK